MPVPPQHSILDESYDGWDAVYRENAPRIYWLMKAKVGNHSDAEDLTTEVFLSAFRYVRVSATVGEVRAYLRMIARTVLTEHWRRTLGCQVAALDLDELPAGTAAPRYSDRLDKRVERILAGLPDRHRRVLELRFLRSYSIRETAAELGITVSNAKVTQYRALMLAAELARTPRPA